LAWLGSASEIIQIGVHFVSTNLYATKRKQEISEEIRVYGLVIESFAFLVENSSNFRSVSTAKILELLSYVLQSLVSKNQEIIAQVVKKIFFVV
jgi:hypothetical protein